MYVFEEFFDTKNSAISLTFKIGKLMKNVINDSNNLSAEFNSGDFMKYTSMQSGELLIETILTFRPSINFVVAQEFTEVLVRISSGSKNTIDLLNQEYFPQIRDFCTSCGRDCGELIKISSCAPWTLYKECTKLDSLMDYGHNGKWYFGDDREDLDVWEIYLADKFGFGKQTHTNC